MLLLCLVGVVVLLVLLGVCLCDLVSCILFVRVVLLLKRCYCVWYCAVSFLVRVWLWLLFLWFGGCVSLSSCRGCALSVLCCCVVFLCLF